MARKRNSNNRDSMGKEADNGKETQGRESGRRVGNRPSRTGRDSKGNPTPKGDFAKDESASNPEQPKETNDPEWYARDPQLLLDAARCTTSDPMGAALVLPEDNFSGGPVSVGKKVSINFTGGGWSIPGLCTLRTKPSYGYAHDRNDPLNVAAQMLYTHVRYVNSGRKNYDPADLMMYVITMSEIYAFIFWIERAYNMAFMYSQRNWYFGKAMLREQGFDPDAICKNLANLRYWINSYINKVASFVIPGSIEMFRRRIFMYSSVYTDSSGDNIKDQLYQFTPVGFYQFNGMNGSSCKFRSLTSLCGNANFANRVATVDDIAAIGDSLLLNIFGDEDFGLMSGDILKAFGDDRFGISQMGDEGLIVPVFDEAVLMQIKNATILSSLDWDDNVANRPTWQVGTGSTAVSGNYGDIRQDANGNIILCEACVDFNPTGTSVDAFARNAVHMGTHPVLSFREYPAEPASVVENTRLTIVRKTNPSPDFVQDNVVLVVGCSDIIVDATTLNMAEASYSNVREVHWSNLYSSITTRAALDAANFKYLPITMQGTMSVAVANNIKTVTAASLHVLSDIWNYTVQDKKFIERLHEVALLSLLYVPGVSKIVNS